MTIEEVIIKEVGQEKWDAMPLAVRQGLIEAYARSQFINQETERFIKHFETFVKHSPRGLYVEEAILILARAIQVFQQNHVNLIRAGRVEEENKKPRIIVPGGNHG